MNKFVALFAPSKDEIEKMPYKDQVQLPLGIFGNLIFFFGFTMIFIAEIIRGTYLSAACTGTTVLLIICSIILVKKNKVKLGMTLDTIGILIEIVAIVFLLHGKDNIFEIYRSGCFIVVMGIFNQLFAIENKQLYLYFFLSLIIWVMAAGILFTDFFKISITETGAALSIGSFAIISANIGSLLLNKQKDKINKKAEEEAAVTEKNLNVLKNLFNQSRQNLEIGNRLNSEIKTLDSSFSEIENLYRYLLTQSGSLNSHTGLINDSSNQVLSQVKEMKDTIYDQNNSLSQASASVAEISEDMNKASLIADDKRASLKSLAAEVSEQQKKIKELAQDVENVRVSTTSIYGMVETVNSIANKTNILSMNAGIEAAHSGEAGKGFAVIADEIRSLSNETTVNAQRIASELDSCVELSNKAYEAAKKCITYTATTSTNLNSGVEVIEKILTSFSKMSESSTQVVEELKRIVAQSKNTNELVNNSVIQIQSQGTAISQISDFAQELENRVKEMRNMVSVTTQALDSVKNIAKENASSSAQFAQTLA